jgi:hypothetical protein
MNIPADLRERAQWVVWRYERRDGKPTKVPHNPNTGTRASSTDPDTWSDFETAVGMAEQSGVDGVGYVFTPEDPFCGVDLDDCIAEGEMHPDAATIVRRLATYSERSVSGNGAHAIGRAGLNGFKRNRTGRTPWGGQFEVYDKGRFFCMTGERLPGAPEETADFETELAHVLAELFPKPDRNEGSPPDLHATSRTDAEVLECAFAAKNGSTLQALYRGDVGGYGSRSEADLALSSMLAFWTGPNPDQLYRLVRGSGLIRDKWKRADYRDSTIAKALECAEFFDWEKPKSHAHPSATKPPDTEPIDTAELLDEIRTFVRRFVVLPTEETADLLALWVLHSHAFEASWATPYLRIVSAAPNSGKTLLMEVLAAITRRGWHAINPSVAVLYRQVDRQQPTLLLDEMDNYPIDERRDALSVLNGGYKRGAKVDRCKDNGDLEEFAVYCPKAFAGIDARALVDTLLSRSITIRMERKVSTEKVDMWIAPLVEPEATRLRERCEAWADQHVEALTDHHPDLLGLINRAAEVWWALLSIAEHGGDDWTRRGREAAKELTTGGDDTDDVSAQVQILLDVRAAFGHEQTIATATLLAKLNELDESPWGARRKGEGLDARGLAKMLRPFKIKPRSVRAEGGSKGYHLDQFEDVFARHLP